MSTYVDIMGLFFNYRFKVRLLHRLSRPLTVQSPTEPNPDNVAHRMVLFVIVMKTTSGAVMMENVPEVSSVPYFPSIFAAFVLYAR